MPYEIAVDARYLPDLMHNYEGQGKNPKDAAQMVIAGLALGGDNLPRVLKLVDAYRDELLKQRDAEDLPPVTLYEGDPLPPLDNLDGKIFRVGILFDRLQAEYIRRQVVQSKATGDTMPTEFDGDPKL